jgi:hypothetical protein
LVAVAVVAGLVVLPAPVVGSWLDGCAEAAPGEIRVGLVVDFGTEPDSSGRVDVACVIVPEGAMASAVVEAWGAQHGGNRWDGLLCAIAGYPTTGCGERTPDGYRYWSYWTGSGGTWTHAGMGPGYRRASEGVIEGWRFQRGAGNPSDPPPRRAATPVCPPAPAPTPAPVPAPQAPAPAPPAPPVVPGPAPTLDDRRADVPPPTSVAPERSPTDEADSDEGPGEAAATGTGEPDDEADDGTGGEGRADPSPGATGPDEEQVELVDGTELAAGAGSGGPGAPPVGLLAVVALAVALGGAAALRFRRSA